jgi:hypothetical protein
MHALRTVILEHTTGDGVHHDWLIEDPRLPDPKAPDARLWAARVSPSPAYWQVLGRFDAEAIAPHRRRYLAYQGPISAGRGRVRRVAQGRCVARLWTRSRIVLSTDFVHRGADNHIELRLCGGSRWVVACG